MRFSTLTAAALVSVAYADFTSYCCVDDEPVSTGDIAWALDPKNGRTAEMGIAGGATYTHEVGMCTFAGHIPMACGKYTTTARTMERAGTQLKNGFIECDDPLYMESNLWVCPF
ncbi:hypothetical protein CORC01_03266 [Colletotrichum orchidophilum]|uniref:Uncharacterized protein n=1 Tax=Colletotrichum orchidophilum TaxID=1209926 RepID=A0A1G4BJ44_9PEZI|nr:uncharacterized protein CORC01_03266 [Colletotrichum orchidophilum]OHF01510.1 hypothetical protein CORC01_03266 [Colletotrichum orchidophilum]